MGLIGSILKFTRSNDDGLAQTDVTIDPGGEAYMDATHFGSPGDDSYPMTTDYVATAKNEQTGGQSAVGYADPINKQVAGKGEKRIYSRDANGKTIAQIWLKNDGSIVALNDSCYIQIDLTGAIDASNQFGSFKLESNGDFVVNGVVIDTEGKITTPTGVESPSVIALGKELAEHTHPITSGSSAPGPTGVNS